MPEKVFNDRSEFVSTGTLGLHFAPRVRVVPEPDGAPKKPISPLDAIVWFLNDMAETSGYAVGGWEEGSVLSVYASYRPMLTAPDPWYFAGVVALEACKIVDLFERDEADELMRQMLLRMDSVVGRVDNDCSELAVLLMGRLGMGALIWHRKVPDNMLAKIMLILLGSASAAAPNMPDPSAHKQLKAALKMGAPVWWKMFRRHYTLALHSVLAERPLLVPSILAGSDRDMLVSIAAEAADNQAAAPIR